MGFNSRLQQCGTNQTVGDINEPSLSETFGFNGEITQQVDLL